MAPERERAAVVAAACQFGVGTASTERGGFSRQSYFLGPLCRRRCKPPNNRLDWPDAPRYLGAGRSVSFVTVSAGVVISDPRAPLSCLRSQTANNLSQFGPHFPTTAFDLRDRPSNVPLQSSGLLHGSCCSATIKIRFGPPLGIPHLRHLSCRTTNGAHDRHHVIPIPAAASERRRHGHAAIGLYAQLFRAGAWRPRLQSSV